MKTLKSFSSLSKSDIFFIILALVAFVLAVAFSIAFQYGSTEVSGVLGLVLFMGVPAVVVVGVTVLD